MVRTRPLQLTRACQNRLRHTPASKLWRGLFSPTSEGEDEGDSLPRSEGVGDAVSGPLPDGDGVGEPELECPSATEDDLAALRRGCCDRILLTPFGTIRHYRSPKKRIAYCRVHTHDCRQTNVGGSPFPHGRPLAYPYLWLKECRSSKYDNHRSHVYDFTAP